MKTNKSLFQWDINQKLIGCVGEYVDFIINDEVFRVEVENYQCLIPDEFLQEADRKTIYECKSDGTILEHKIVIHSRPKPPNYVYTPTEKLTFDGLVQKVNTAVNEITSNIDTINTTLETKAEKSDVDKVSALVGDTTVATQISEAIENIPQPDWNQNDETASDYIKNKPLIATNDDTMDFLAEMGMVTPVTNSNGEILTSPSNEIYCL